MRKMHLPDLEFIHMVYNGKLVADHYISNTRFRNILNKEVKKA